MKLEFIDAGGNTLKVTLAEYVWALGKQREARKFAKATRKQVKLADGADGWMD